MLKKKKKNTCNNKFAKRKVKNRSINNNMCMHIVLSYN